MLVFDRELSGARFIKSFFLLFFFFWRLVLEEGHFEFYEEKFVTVEPRRNICDAVLEIELLAKVS